MSRPSAGRLRFHAHGVRTECADDTIAGVSGHRPPFLKQERWGDVLGQSGFLVQLLGGARRSSSPEMGFRRAVPDSTTGDARRRPAWMKALQAAPSGSVRKRCKESPHHGPAFARMRPTVDASVTGRWKRAMVNSHATRSLSGARESRQAMEGTHTEAIMVVRRKPNHGTRGRRRERTG